MSSLSDSIKLIFTEKFSYLKIFILSYLPFVALKIKEGTYSLGETIDIISYTLLGLLYIGYLFLITAYTVQAKQDVLPPMNPFKMFWVGLKGLFAILPSSLICFIFYNYYLKNLNLEITSNKILGLIFALLLLSIIFTSIIFYTKKFSILEAWNINNTLKNFSQIFLYLILTLILICLIGTLIAIPVLSFITLLFGKKLIYNCVIIYLTTAMLFVYFQNLGYAYFEYIKE